MDGGCGIYNWSEEGFDEEEEPALRRRRTGRWPPPPASPRSSRVLRSRSPSPATSVRTRRRGPTSPDVPAGGHSGGGGSTSTVVEERSPSPPASPIWSGVSGARSPATSVRTRRRRPTSPDVAAGGSSGAGAGAGGSDGVEEILASLRESTARKRLFAPLEASGSSASITGAGREKAGSFSFPPLEEQPGVDAGEVLDFFAAVEADRRTRAWDEFFEATMGATANARMEKIKKALLVDEKVLDLAGLERWLRRMEAVAELTWFTEVCSDEDKPAPPLDLFDCAFRALQGACSDELHRGADFRKYWIGSVAVPEFFLCPLSNKIIEDPVVIASGKTVDLSALEKWWSEHSFICPVTDEILPHTIFIPDILILLCITLWRAANDIVDVASVAEPTNISSEEEALFKEISLLAHSPSISDKTYDAILRLHELIDNAQCSILHLLGRSPGVIAKLACILPETCLDPDPELDDIILKIIAKTASYSPNKEVLGDDQYAIPVLIARALLGPVATRVKCAQILGLLADNYYNKIKIGELGGFAALMELLLFVGDIDIKKMVAMAIANLCEAEENWSRFLREGVDDAAISLLRNDGLVDEAHNILLQADGFELAMMQILDKLNSFGGDANCEKMAESLWHSFIRSKSRPRRAELPPTSASASASNMASDTSSEASVELPMNIGLREQTKKDVRTIVSWLQKKSYYPRTYRYRD
ncbi:hypothetical protein GUJ93_ZPchr0004g39914 [Zizania palustris]|uniref:U-box domain-containing protein n=1 Tax=Zizania palustris TaxID=103762 RepID=A0A8J5S4N0_ZIZPA|nr:hypothetical protein GUJ93_ZPchr0004g39914 [Zizania palustris]